MSFAEQIEAQNTRSRPYYLSPIISNRSANSNLMLASKISRAPPPQGAKHISINLFLFTSIYILSPRDFSTSSQIKQITQSQGIKVQWRVGRIADYNRQTIQTKTLRYY